MNLEKVNHFKRIFSGIQPSGIPHIGNYFGAIKQWVELIANNKNNKSNNEYIYCIVDLHAITVPYEPSLLRKNIINMVATFLACGLNPLNCTLFQQSNISAHTELAWILGSQTSTNWLNRMTQYKDKIKNIDSNNKNNNNNNNIMLGLYSYPILMASDILLYNATHVPVGDDQKQHLELTRSIASNFNKKYKKEYFKIPTTVIGNKTCSRLMSLKNPNNKMSKSDISEFSRINLTDTPEEIKKKINKSVTDNIIGISYDVENRPGLSNLLSIYNATSGISINELCTKYQASTISDFKMDLTENLVQKICPIGKNIKEYQKDPEYLKSILKSGADKANEIASKNINEIKNIVGFI